MAVPFAFANLSGNIALAKLDSNFNTPITLGTTSILLGNTATSINGLTLSNVTITSGNVTALGTALPVSSGGTGLVTLPVNNVLLGNGTGSIAAVSPGTAGNVLTSIGGVWVSNAAASGGGTVTSVGGTGTVNGITLSGTVTSSGSLTLGGTLSGVSLTTQVSGTLPVANGGTGVTASTGTGSVVLNTSPTLTTPTLISPALGTPTSGSLVATTNIPVANATGTLAVANGGTGLTTIPAGNVVIGNGTSALYGVAPGTAGNVLTSIAGVWTSNAVVGGGGSPGGSTTQVQFNNAGSFAGDANLTFSGSTLTSANLIVSNLTASLAVFSSATKQLVSNPITGTGSVVMNASPIITSPSLITPALGSPTSGNMAATTSIPVANATGTLVVANGGTGLTSGTSGGIPYFSSTSAITSSAALAANALVIGGGAGAAPATTTTGTGILTFLGTPSSANFASAVTDETGTGLVVFNSAPALTNPTVTNYVETLYSANTSTAITVDLTNGTVQNLTLTGNATITMPTAVAGKSFIIILSQDGTGGRTVTWSTVSWPSATAPTITSTASKKDIYSFFSNGTSWFGTTIGQNY